MYIIKAPNKKHTGVTAGVAFANGEGKTDNENLVKWFKSRGYEVEEDTSSDDKQLTEKEQLQLEAKELGIEFEDKTTIKELKKLIAEAKAAAASEE